MNSGKVCLCPSVTVRQQIWVWKVCDPIQWRPLCKKD